jgi:hypothetical protein
VAGAPYIGPDAKVGDRDGATADELLASAAESGMKWIKDVTLQYQTTARYYRLHALSYEGGPGFDGTHSVEGKVAANRDPRIGKLIQDYFTAWYSNGGELFMYGSWGLTEDIRKQTFKTKAIAQLKAAPMPAVTAGFAVPGTILAWQHNSHEGGGSENSADGGKNLAFIKEGQWFDYLLNVTAPGDYAITLQSASGQDGSQVEILMSGQSLGKVAGKNTGDWQKWGSSDPVLVRLEKGQIVLRLRIAKAGLNIRSVTIEKR